MFNSECWRALLGDWACPTRKTGVTNSDKMRALLGMMACPTRMMGLHLPLIPFIFQCVVITVLPVKSI